ncbi:hypothetical protein CYMTET_44004 [Cymbomonas tetramitiformis]|uniref:Uncharacterized protein n=1 Tax=Cymbomonas tetramitiformis TaxID=36881 RepID=A0AAE0F005_9CHLO|nr:hypothetical protein CYMTET_44004 [Cymbomonas tetramitiformis]
MDCDSLREEPLMIRGCFARYDVWNSDIGRPELVRPCVQHSNRDHPRGSNESSLRHDNKPKEVNVRVFVSTVVVITVREDKVLK